MAAVAVAVAVAKVEVVADGESFTRVGDRACGPAWRSFAGVGTLFATAGSPR